MDLIKLSYVSMQVAKGFMKNVYPCKAAIGLLTQLMSYGVELVEGGYSENNTKSATIVQY